MLKFADGMATVMVGVMLGLFIVSSPSLNAPLGGVGAPTAIYDSRPSVPVRSCDSLWGGGVVVRCEAPDNHAQFRGKQASSAVPENSAWLNALAMGPDPGGKASKEPVDKERSDAKPTPSTSPEPTPGQNPREEEKRQKRSTNSWLQGDCDARFSTLRPHCFSYLTLHVYTGDDRR